MAVGHDRVLRFVLVSPQDKIEQRLSPEQLSVGRHGLVGDPHDQISVLVTQCLNDAMCGRIRIGATDVRRI
jgi:hypothetical protein